MASSATVALPPSTSPKNAGLVLTALILGAGVANMNLAVANVGLPDIGRDLGASQAGLNIVAAGFSLGLASTVLYLGALGDRYGRKMMLMMGLIIGVPAAFMSALSPNIEMLAASRLIGGFAAGMAYPTTLALITALWSGPARTRAIALWSAIGAAMSASSTLLAGAVLMILPWGYSFLIAVPFAVVAIVLVWKLVPAHVNETKDKVDHLGGVLSGLFVGTLVLGINYIALDGQRDIAVALLGGSAVTGFLFFWRQKRVGEPLFDLKYAARPPFWVAAVSGIIVFGSLMGAMFVGQQFLQNVLGYNTLEAGAAILPCAITMVIVAPFSSTLIEKRGSRITLLLGFIVCMAGFMVMLFGWNIHTPLGMVALSYVLIGAGVGFAGTPASHALTDSVPVTKVGMASGTGDLQRDLGGSIMQSLLGAILGAGYAAAISRSISAAPAATQAEITTSIGDTLRKSFGSAEDLASKYPDYSQAIMEAAKQSFLDGANWAYASGIFVMLIGMFITFFFFPKKNKERELYAEYAKQSSTVH
ncbi:MFS transporter [Aurantimicrobium minutum]|uniref:MFS transporter n=1 Tax=Aurantimicrobium minutum TaxID=708131 RepID=UPI002472F625|nr:MFS transporter [Aurantimicrobium minutum]MDH6422861.1 DHA2 family multidrug resistance protein-like MFS transporter [Aurantimicrobium minutum]